jgi:alpha-galactosidase
MSCRTVAAFLVCLVVVACRETPLSWQHGNLQVSVDDKLHVAVQSADAHANSLTTGTAATEYLVTATDTLQDFRIDKKESAAFSDKIGAGTRWVIQGVADTAGHKIRKIVTLRVYSDFPDLMLLKAAYINETDKPVSIRQWVNHHYTLSPVQDTVVGWSFQGESTGERRDWVLPLKPGFYQRNYMGMNNSDYGGGIPVTDVWHADQGLAVGHVELAPRLVELPVSVDAAGKTTVQISRTYDQPYALAPGDTLHTDETFVLIHHGDYYTALKQYGTLLQARGLTFPEPEEGAFEASWCAWGYMREVTLDEIRGTFPKVKSLGIKWVTIDDGFQQAEGDWHVNTKKFPGGDAQMKALVDEIHAQGMKAMLWWAPLAADSGSQLLQAQPDLRLINAEGKPQQITWWDAWYLSPGYTGTLKYTKETVDLFMRQWGFDGLKMDGQHMNAVPPDYNTHLGGTDPEQAVRDLPQFFHTIWQEAKQINPHALIQNCPCGTCMSVFNMPYMNQAVASDPLNSWQVRLKGRAYKALIGKTAYFGDHVELSDGRKDFASSFGIGAVLGTKFTWPKENPAVTEDNLLTPEKEQLWKKWFMLYHRKMLSKEPYRGELYTLGYDLPETHVVQKGDTLHYAFYSDQWNGAVELRGLEDKVYTVRDYVNNVTLGEVSRANPKLPVTFTQHLLLEAYPR